MFTALYLFMVAPLLVLLLGLLVAVRVARANFLEGLLVFFFFLPLGALWALLAHWRDPEVRVRVPALLALAISIAWMSVYVSGSRAEQGELARLAARRASVGAESTLARELRLSTAIADLPMRSGTVQLAGAHARIDVPAHFRFVERSSLEALFRQFDDELDRETVGWLVHESVNLADDNAWFVVVDWHGDGYVPEAGLATLSADQLLLDAQRATAALAQQQDEDYRLLRYAAEPELDAGRHLVTWVEETSSGENPDRVVDCYAARLGRHGVFEFTLTDMAPRRQELCLRSVRLAATRTTFADGEGYEDHSRLFDHKAGYDLAGLVTGTALLKP